MKGGRLHAECRAGVKIFVSKLVKYVYTREGTFEVRRKK